MRGKGASCLVPQSTAEDLTHAPELGQRPISTMLWISGSNTEEEMMPSLGKVSALWRWVPALVILAIFLVGYLGQSGSASVGPAPAFAPAPTSVAPAASPSDSGASAKFDVDSVDLGQVPLGALVTYSFHVGNVGPAPLVIDGTWAKALEGC